MFTIFHLIQLIIAVFCLIQGIYIGNSYFGWFGILGGAIIGGYAGLYLGRIPLLLSLFFFRRTLKKTDTTGLKERLKTDYFVSHLIIAVLLKRGESVEQFRNYVVSQLQSSNPNERRFGWENLNLWFPELAMQLAPFNTEQPTYENINVLNSFQKEESVNPLEN